MFFCLMLACNRFCHWPTALSMMFCYMLAHALMKWGAASSRLSQRLVLRTGVCTMNRFLHQSTNSVVNRTFGGLRSGEIKSGVSCWRSWTFSRAYSDVRTRHFRRSYLKANKVSKSEGTKKVENAYHFKKCADVVYQKLSKLVHSCRNYSLPKLTRCFRDTV